MGKAKTTNPPLLARLSSLSSNLASKMLWMDSIARTTSKVLGVVEPPYVAGVELVVDAQPPGELDLRAVDVYANDMRDL